MHVSMMLPPEPDESWEIARQMGVTHAVTSMPRPDDGVDPWAYEPLLRLKQRFVDAGFELAVIEDRPPLDDVRLGNPGREEQVENVITLLENMGRLDIPVWCSAWMAKMGWLRTSLAAPDRGGSLVTTYDHSLMAEAPPVGDVSEEQLWDGLEYFIERVGPVAEDAGVRMAMHPDDPPLSPVRGVGRIMTSVEAFDRLLEIYPSEYNGLTFCQGNFAAMGADVPEVIEHFGDRINFAHFRDVEGTAESFRETWHDDGPTDMRAAMDAYERIGFEGPIRPDHAPTMAGESNDSPGYETKGKIFAVGYMKGLLE